MNYDYETQGGTDGAGLVDAQQPAPTVAPVGPAVEPKEGGSYCRDPETGSLTKVEGPQSVEE